MLKGSFYDDFYCIADKCPFTCCGGGWFVSLKDEELAIYKEEPYICQGIDAKAKKMLMKNDGNCYFLDDEGLCKLVCKYGPDVLCSTCTKFPRAERVYMGVEEKMLSNACPKVLDLLYNTETPLAFCSDAALSEEYLMKEEVLIRSIMIDILQYSCMPLWKRLYIVYRLAHRLNNSSKEGIISILTDYSDIEYLRKQEIELSEIEIGFDVILKETQAMFDSVNERDDYHNHYISYIESYYEKSVDAFIELLKKDNNRYQEWFSEYEVLFENIAVNFAVCNFLCESISDIEKQAITLLIEMSMAYYTLMRNKIEARKDLQNDDVYCIICYYARIFEHNTRQFFDFIKKLFYSEGYCSGNLFAICKIMDQDIFCD